MATVFKISPRHNRELENFCEEKISKKVYYLHGNRFGGTGWNVRQLTDGLLEVTINDDKLALIAMLKWTSK